LSEETYIYAAKALVEDQPIKSTTLSPSPPPDEKRRTKYRHRPRHSAAQRHGTASDFFFFSSPPLFPRLQRSGEQVVGKQGKGRREAQYLWVEEEVESAKRATTTWWRWRSPSGGWSLSSPKAGGAIKKQPAAAGRPTAANRP
jgi:hypothetical protein